jgi:ubiquinone biosynthesis protein COQ9
MGWSESAMVAGARDVGVSPAIVGAFPRKEAALVEVALLLLLLNRMI